MDISEKKTILEEIKAKTQGYYSHIYKDKLGLKNHNCYIDKRLEEDQEYISFMEKYMDIIPFFYEKKVNQKNILILGAGTGAEFVNFNKLGYNTYGVEPCKEALEILRLKCEYYGYDQQNIKEGIAEAIPYDDSYFDFVWCWTVLEHVQDIKKSLNEIYRVLKPGGWAFLLMPDYRHFYEEHYKMYLPLFLPKFFNKLLLLYKKRPTKYFDTEINFINARVVKNILNKLNLNIMFLTEGSVGNSIIPKSLKEKFFLGFTRLTGIQQKQIWIIQKKK